MLRRFFIICCLMVMAPEPIKAQDVTADIDTVLRLHAEDPTNHTMIDSLVNRLLTDAISQYDQGQYTASAQALQAMTALNDLVAPALVAQILKYLAFNYIAMRQHDRAGDAFHDALLADPTLALGDDAVIAPKIRRVFTLTRREMLFQMQRHNRLQTLWRSFLVPGWGQLYRGDRLKGYSFMAVQIGLLTGMGLAIHNVGASRDRYVGFGAEDAIAVYSRRRSIDDLDAALLTRFNTYKSSIKRANVMIILAAGVWSLNMLDALLLSGQQGDFDLSRRPDTHTYGMAMTWDPASRRWTMGYQLRW